MRVGADLWRTDLAGILSAMTTRALPCSMMAIPSQAYAAAVIQLESSRLGLTNDNDYIYYTFGGAFNVKPHRFAIDVAWFRDRCSGAMGQPQAQFGQQQDTVMVSPELARRVWSHQCHGAGQLPIWHVPRRGECCGQSRSGRVELGGHWLPGSRSRAW